MIYDRKQERQDVEAETLPEAIRKLYGRKWKYWPAENKRFINLARRGKRAEIIASIPRGQNEENKNKKGRA